MAAIRGRNAAVVASATARMPFTGAERDVEMRIAGGGARGVLELNVDGGGWDAVCKMQCQFACASVANLKGIHVPGDDGFGDDEAAAFCREFGYDWGQQYDATHGDNVFAADDISCPEGTMVSGCSSSRDPYTDNCVDSETVGISCFAGFGCAAGTCDCWGNHVGEFCEQDCGCSGRGTQTNLGAARAARSCASGSCTCESDAIGQFCELECCGGRGTHSDIAAARASDSCDAGTCSCDGDFAGSRCQLDCGCSGHGTQTNIGGARAASAVVASATARMAMGGTERSVQIRIAGGDSRGVLELAIDGDDWDAVCDDGFGDDEAAAFCYELGYEHGAEYTTTHGDDSFAADDIRCRAGAAGISECSSSEPYEDNCVDTETVGIECSAPRLGNCAAGSCVCAGGYEGPFCERGARRRLNRQKNDDVQLPDKSVVDRHASVPGSPTRIDRYRSNRSKHFHDTPGTIRPGNCGATSMANHCNGTHRSGAWNTTVHNITSLSECVEKCKACSACNYVSFSVSGGRGSPGDEDCSWYRMCDMSNLQHYGAHYLSEVVRSVPPPPPPEASIAVDWSHSIDRFVTAPAIETDLMPFLARPNTAFYPANGTVFRGSFSAYYEALSELGADFNRFSLWYPYPRVAIAALEPPNCSANFTSWNFSMMDEVVKDFMQATNGRTVAPQLSTLPLWMLTTWPRVNNSAFPPEPWQPVADLPAYPGSGAMLTDPSCKQVAEYFARIVGHYTRGGFHDECGRWHESGLYYHWDWLSIMNECEHFGYTGPTAAKGQNSCAQQYSRCLDAAEQAIAQVNPELAERIVGPEFGTESTPTAGVNVTQMFEFYLDGKNHRDGKTPARFSLHWVGSDGPGFHNFDTWFESVLSPVLHIRDRLAPDAQLWVNELSAAAGGSGQQCGGDSDTSWSLAGAFFAYAVGRLAQVGAQVVGQDQLIAGPAPNNNPEVAALCWENGRPNSKFWATHILAKAFANDAPKIRTFSRVNSSADDSIFALSFSRGQPIQRWLLLVGRGPHSTVVDLAAAGACGNETATVIGVDVGAFEPPRSRTLMDGMRLHLGGYAVATVLLCPRDTE